MRIYLDTSAAMKLVLEEPESAALAVALERLHPDDVLLAAWLLHTELRCAARRRSGIVAAEAVEAVLARVLLVDLTRADLLAAPAVGAGLRSQDAVHLAVALRARADSIVTYDDEQASAAERAGMTVLRPGT